MKKRVSLLLVALLAMMQSAFAYDFSAVAPSGQTLYYNIVNGEAQVTRQNFSSPYYSTYPTGALTIPGSVTNNGTTYAVTSIGNYAFDGCSSLTSVTIPNSVTSIGYSAFSGCSGLTSVTIPNGVTSIGNSTFSDCYNLTSVTIPNGVTSIGNYAFQYCTNLTSVTIPNGVTSIGNSAFSGCSGLTSVTIPNSVTSIGNYAFYYCTSLTSVTIPNSVTSIGVDAFFYVRHIVYHGNAMGSPWGASFMNGVIDGGFVFSDSTKHNLMVYIGTGGTVTIPNTVVTIGARAFSSYGNLTSVVIPNSVTSIGNYAFFFCTGLTSVTIGNSVTSIGDYAFYYCSILTSVTIPNSVISIGEDAFHDCSGLTSVTIPNSVTSIGEDAFHDCKGLTSVTIPNSVTSIGSGAFYNVHHIEYHGNATGSPWGAISMNGVVDGDFVYSDATRQNLMAYIGTGGAVTIPNTVVTIGEKTFFWCRITSVIIPNNVTSIGNSAFYGCGSLTSATLGGKNLSVFSNDTTKGSVRITLPNESTTNLWNRTVNTSATAKEGNQFVTWSDGVTASSRTITLTENTTLTAIFTLRQYTLDVQSSNPDYGSVSGGGRYYSGDTVTVTAYPAEHCRFIRWNDNSTENPHQVIITGDTYLTAYFAIDTYTVTVQSNDLTRGYVTKSGTEFAYGSSCTVTATAFSGYTFACWSDGTTENQYTFAVQQDMDLTAVFVAEGEQLYTVTLQSANPSMGTVSGGGRAVTGSDVVIKAKGKQGYRFLRWNDNNTDSIRTVHVSGDITYTAYFESTAFGIDDVESTEAKPIIFARDGNIIVREAQRMDVRVYDMMGRRVAYSNTAEEHDIPVPTAGIYLVKVGTLPARKVVVVR